MELVKVSCKGNKDRIMLDALQVDDNQLVQPGDFDYYSGLDFYVGKSLKNYTRFDFKEITECFGLDTLFQSRELQQYLFDMFLGAIIYLVKDCPAVQKLLVQKAISYSESYILTEFFRSTWLAQGMPSVFKFEAISVDSFINSFSITNEPPNMRGCLSPAFNTLDIFKYERTKTGKENRWCYSKDFYHNESAWSGVRVMPEDVEKKLTGPKLGSIYFTDTTLSIQSAKGDEYIYITKSIPEEVYSKLTKYIPCLFVNTLDTMLPLLSVHCDVDLTEIENYSVLDEVMLNYCESLNNSLGR